MRRTIYAITCAVLANLAIAPLHAEDLSHLVWVASSQDARGASEGVAASQTQTSEVLKTSEASDSASETIPAPPQIPLECPTLEQLGYRTKPLAELSLDVGIDDELLPADCSDGLFQAVAPSQDARSWFATEFNWAASDLFAQPAYFDDPVLERYGQTRHPLVQPWLSGVHFFGQFPLMPYKIAVDRPFEKVYTLGYHRPGSPLPCMARRLPRP